MIEKYNDFVTSFPKFRIVTSIEIGLVFAIASLVVSFLMYKHIERLFVNINKDKTPFTLDNADHIGKMAWLMIVLIVLPLISDVIFSILLGFSVDTSVAFPTVIEILFLFAMMYVFKYGCKMELEKNN